jgi:hypothetical protein
LFQTECKVESDIDSVKVVYGMFTSSWEAYRDGNSLYIGGLKRGIAFFNVPKSLWGQCPARDYWWDPEQRAFVPHLQPYMGESDDWSHFAFPGFFSLLALGVGGWIVLWIRKRPHSPSG